MLLLKPATLFLAIFILNASQDASAWTFGPKNYEDCVLAKMKGQDRSMAYIATQSCEKQFPYPKEIYLNASDTEFSWWSDANSLYIRITKNRGDYNILRASFEFRSQTCDGKDLGTGNTFSSQFEFNKDGVATAAAKDASQYRCMRIKEPVIGIMKKQ